MLEIMCSFSDENRVVFLRLLWVLTCGETQSRIRLDESKHLSHKSPPSLKRWSRADTGRLLLVSALVF